ncbi:MAG: IS3 family transposase [Anaerolineales bacterium]|nr:IS3 family transposase [Anaerolineales bacterium]
MPRTRHPYPEEFRRKMVELVRAGRSPYELSKEFEPTAVTISSWVKQADLDEGRRADGLTTDERNELARLRRENKQLRIEREILGKSRSLVRTGDRLDTTRVFEFVKANQANYPIATMCRVLGVSTSGYYAWLKRQSSRRSREDAILTDRIRWIHLRSRGTYGSPRIHAELREEGVHVGRKRVARLMQAAGLQGVSRRKSTRTTIRQPGAQRAPDLVNRDFDVAGPNRLWVADITYVRTWAGFLYLAVVVDAWSRRVVGWAMANHLRTELVNDALEMAVRQRRPKGVIHHSDQGSQYTSLAFGKRCREAGIRPSMGSVGDCYDNALCESFFATLECELLDRRRFGSREEAGRAVFEFIEGWYNPHRRHSSIGYASPVRYEMVNDYAA